MGDTQEWKGPSAKNQYNKNIRNAGFSTPQKLQELDHNILDNKGNKIVNKFYDEKFKMISYDKINDITAKYLVREDDCKNGFEADISELTQQLQDKSSKGIGHFTTGFISSQSTGIKKCIIKSSSKKNISIEHSETDVPKFSNFHSEDDKNILQKLNCDTPPDSGSLIIFILDKNKLLDITKEDLNEVAKSSSIESYYDDTKLKEHKYVSDIECLEDYNYKKKSVIALDCSDTVPKAYYPSLIKEGVITHYQKLKDVKNKKKNMHEMLEPSNIGSNDVNIDAKITANFSICPYEKYTKDIKENNSGTIIVMKINGNKYVMSQPDTNIDFTKHIFNGYTYGNNPHNTIEIIIEIEIVKMDCKNKIYDWLGICSIKPKSQKAKNNKHFLNHIWFAMEKILEEVNKNIATDTNGKIEKCTSNTMVDSNNIWWTTKNNKLLEKINDPLNALMEWREKKFGEKKVRAAAVMFQKVFRGRTVRARMRATALEKVVVKEHDRNKPVTIGEMKVYLKKLTEHCETLHDSQYAPKGNEIKKIWDEVSSKQS